MNINQLMKQANQMQRKLDKLQNEFNERIFDFESNDHQITGKMKGNMEIVELNVSDEVYKSADKEMLLDMIMVCLNEQRKTISELKDKELNSIAGNVAIPNRF